MKEINVDKGKIGIVYNRRKELITVLSKNNFWLQLLYDVVVHNVEDEFLTNISDTELNQNQQLVMLLKTITVLAHEIVLVYKHGILQNVLTKGVHRFWKVNANVLFTKYDLNEMDDLNKYSHLDTSDSLLKEYIREVEVFSYEQAVLLVDDKYVKILHAGIYKFWKCSRSIKYNKIDMRKKQIEISGQELLTKDKATIRINLNAFYNVNNIEKALIDNHNFESQIYTLLQLSLRSFVSMYSLDDLLENKNEISKTMLNDIVQKTNYLGVQVLDCGIKDIILTGEMRAIMNQVLEAQKKSQANVIVRREENAAVRSMLNTAKLMEENKMLFNIKEMEHVEKIADKIGEISLSGNGNLIKQLKEVLI